MCVPVPFCKLRDKVIPVRGLYPVRDLLDREIIDQLPYLTSGSRTPGIIGKDAYIIISNDNSPVISYR